MHKTANVLAALPDRMRGEAKGALQAIYTAETRAAALDAARDFAEQFAAWSKASAKITDDLERLLTFHDFPAEHHVHLRTTNPIESTFATVRLRQRVTKGAGSREAGLAMAFKLLDAAQDRWRRVNAPHLVAVVRAGTVFIDGQLQERNSDQPTDERTPPDPLDSAHPQLLTIAPKLLNEAPDAIHIAAQSEFTAGTIVKQARELGYEGPYTARP